MRFAKNRAFGHICIGTMRVGMSALFLILGSASSSAQDSEPQPQATLLGHKDEVNRVAFSPDGSLLASIGAGDQTLRLWNVATGAPRAVFTNKKVYEFLNLAFSRDANVLATSSNYHGQGRGRQRHWPDETVEVWDVATGKNRVIFTTPEVVFDLQYSPNGKMLAMSVSGVGVLVWDVASERFLSTLDHGNIPFSNSSAFSSDGTMLATETGEGIAIWNTTTWQRQSILKGNRGMAGSLAFSPDGKYLASGSSDNTVRVWYLFTKELLATLKGFKGAVDSVAYSPDGTLLAAGCRDGTFRLFDATTLKDPVIVKGHKNVVRRVVFSSDGKLLATGSRDRTIKLWNVADVLKKGAVR